MECFPHIERFDSLSAAQRVLADRLLETVHAVLQNKKSCHVAFSGGKSPIGFFKILASEEMGKQLPWDYMHIYWVDERYVPHHDPSSNFGSFLQAIRGRISIPPSGLHPACPLGLDIESAAREYERTIRKEVPPSHVGGIPSFDFMFLGLGIDGHTASLFPGHPSVAEKERLIVPIMEPIGLPPVPRVTMTLPLINAAKRVFFLVAGKGKQAIANEIVCRSASSRRYPAALVHPTGATTWLLTASTE